MSRWGSQGVGECQGQNEGDLPSAARVLDGLAEGLIYAMLLVATLLYSSHLSNNFLAKSGVILILGSGAFAAWLAARLACGRLILFSSSIYLPFGAYLAAQSVALAAAQNRGRALEVVAQNVVYLLVFVVVLHLYRDERRRQRLVGTILALSLCVSGIGLLQLVGLDVVGLPPGALILPISTLGNPNFAAHYLDLILPLAAALAVMMRGRAWGYVGAGVLLSAGLHMVLTDSQGGWLSAGVGLGAMAMVSKSLRRWAVRLAVASVVIALLGLVAGLALKSVDRGDGLTLYDQTAAALGGAVDRGLDAVLPIKYSRTMRVLIWKDTVDLIRANPWVGVGPGSYGFHLPVHRSTVSHRSWRELVGVRDNVPYHAHNEYLETWAESGILGVAALVWLLSMSLLVSWRGAVEMLRGQGGAAAGRAEPPIAAASAATGPPGPAAVVLGCAGSLTAAAVHAVFSFNLLDPVSGTHVWVFIGLVGAAIGRTDTLIQLGADRPRRRAAAFLGGGSLALVGIYLGVCIVAGDIYYAAGMSELAYGHPNRALLAFRQAVEWRGREFRHHHTLGKTALELGRLAEAEAALLSSLDLHPHNPQALRLLGRTLLARQAPERAADAFRRAVRIEPLKKDNYVLLADALAQAGDHGGAIQARQQALAFRPEDARLMMSLAIAYREAGQIAEAETVLERARSLSPRDGVIVGNQGAIQLLLGNLVAAEEHLRTALLLDKENRVSWRANLAQTLMLQGRLDEALDEARRAAAEAPGDPVISSLVEQLQQSVEGESDD